MISYEPLWNTMQKIGASTYTLQVKGGISSSAIRRLKAGESVSTNTIDALCQILLVIDDFGLMDLDLDKCRDLFEVLDTRDGRKSTVVISQFPVSTWFDTFADNTYADACLTRITDKHHTYRLEMNGINMRETE